MTSDMLARADRASAPVLGAASAIRLASALAATCFGLHAVLLLAGPADMRVMTWTMLVLALPCVVCGARAWRHPGTARDALMLMAGGALMVAAHLVLTLIWPHAATSMSVADAAQHHMSDGEWPMTAAVAVAAMQVAVAACAWVHIRRSPTS